ncbi:MAG: hypothetical protein DMD88_19760 [Candidatus Rokuibacteriota bacterium]|nr:MAG: hypothetical protein DMD88_19760 [Candidatus Rokubacteria bacterium]
MSEMRGYTLLELIIAIALIAIVTAIGFPLYLSFSRAQETDGAARELRIALNQARQLAITRNTSYSVQLQSQNQLRFVCAGGPSCPAGTVWTGAGTDGSGWMKMDNSARIVLFPTAITFSALGAATTTPSPGRLRVQNASGTSSLDVCVNPSGGTRIMAPGSCP